MDNKIVTTQRAGINGDIVQIILGEGAELPNSLHLVEKTFKTCLQKNDVQMIINMAKINFPSTKFIALLLEVTTQARRLGGDVKLINISNSARNNLMTFSAITYLSIEDSEEYAFSDFDEKFISLQNIETKKMDTKNIDIVPENKKKEVVQNLINYITDTWKGHISTGTLGTKYVFDVLTANDFLNVAYNIVNKETYPGWGYMLSHDATTLWELWEYRTGDRMNSHNHIMLGSVGEWFYKSLAGIQMDQSLSKARRFLPHIDSTEGFFICKIMKHEL